MICLKLQDDIRRVKLEFLKKLITSYKCGWMSLSMCVGLCVCACYVIFPSTKAMI